MGRQIFSDGVLVEKWDDETRTYTGPNGSRPYTEDEMRAISLADRIEEIRDEARAIADNATMTGAQAAVAVQRLARVVENLADRTVR